MTDTAARTPIPRIISVDDHIVEPPHLWQAWLPERFRERGPRVDRRRLGEMKWVGGAKMYEYELDVPDAPWCDVWFFEDLVHPNKRHVAAVGFDRDEMTLSPITYDEMRPGCYDPKARVQDMLANHVEASLSFPTMPRFCGQTFYEASAHDLGLACVQAYNDYMIEEWCGDSDGALIPLIIIPLWDVDLAAAEVRRNAERGCHAVCFSASVYHPCGHATHACFLSSSDQQEVSVSRHSNRPAAHEVHVDFSAFVASPSPHFTHVPDDADRVPALE